MGRLITEEAVYEYLTSKFDEFDISIFEFAGKILDGLGDIPTACNIPKKYNGWYLNDYARGFNACVDKIRKVE